MAEPRAQRADAQRNRARLLDAARAVVTEQGTQASLREVARRADVGLGTLYRHFPSRDALLEALLREMYDGLAERARVLEASRPPEPALHEWLGEFLTGSTTYRGLSAAMVATLDDETSPLHASCSGMRAAAARLIERAQAAGLVRPDVDRTDLFALVSAIGWIGEEAPTLASRGPHLFELVMDAIRVR